MPALMDSPAGQSAPGVNRQRRIPSIVPAIPRKLEKKPACNVAQPSISLTTIEKERGPSRRDSSVANEINENPESRRSSVTKEEIENTGRRSSPIAVAEEIRENLESEKLEVNTNSGSVQVTRSRKQSKDEGALQDERNHSKTEPPVCTGSYPLKKATITSPDSLTSSEEAISQSSAPTFPQPPTFHSNPTPPIDEVSYPDTSCSYYQGYGHMPHSNFSSQPTPPTDQTPSPIDVSFKLQNQVSFEIQPPPYFHVPHPVHSFYQGYSYGNVHPIYSPVARSSPSQHSPTHSEHDIRLLVGNEDEARPSVRYEIENRSPSTISQKSTYLESKKIINPVESQLREVALPNGIHPEYTNRDGFVFPHRAPSEFSRNVKAELAALTQTDHKPSDLFSTMGSKHDAWRHVPTTLDHAPKNDPSNPSHLVNYLDKQFNTIEHADCRLRLSHESLRFEAIDFFLHGLLIDQSPLLRELRKSTRTRESGIAVLQIQTRDRFITPLAVETALRFCYGKSMDFTASSSDISSLKSSVEVSVSWMENALALVAAGQLFQLESVISWGSQIASNVLDWKNIERGLSFALDSGLEQVLDPTCPLAATTESASSPFGDGTTAVASSSPGSSERFILGSSTECEEPSDTRRENYFPSANCLLRQFLDFIISRFPQSWELDTTAAPLAGIDRLPAVGGSRSPLTKSKLSMIQFGDHPSEKTRSSDANITLSSLLLSIPYHLLKYILDGLEETMRNKIINSIVGERERRRRQALRFESVGGSQQQAGAEKLAQVGWEEYVDPQNGSLGLQRKWVALPEGSGI